MRELEENFEKLLRVMKSFPVKYLYEFGRFRLDARESVFYANGKIVKLTPKALQTLILLVERSGHIVEKEEFFATVWADTFVEDAVLSFNISQLRKMLAGFDGKTKFIETVPRRGFRFTADVREIDETMSPIILEKRTFSRTVIDEIENSNAPGFAVPEISNKSIQVGNVWSSIFSKNNVQNLIRRYLIALLVCVGLLAAVTVFYFSFRPKNEPFVALQIKSIAVLPLKSFAPNNDDESLRLRITDALITELASDASDFSVRPTSAVLPFVKTEKTVLEIGRTLEVDAILDGRVQQEGERLRVTLQLVSVKTGEQIWSQQFDGKEGEILNLQDAISSQLSQKLNLRSRHNLAKRPTSNTEAYEAYLKGRYFSSKRGDADLYKAIDYFKNAITLDPEFAEAYAGLANTQYVLFDYDTDVTPENVSRAKENVQHALLLKPDSADALITLGYIATTFDWDWNNAEKSLKKASSIAPNSPDARMRYGMLLVRLRRFDEAQSELVRAIELDPLSLNLNVYLGVLYFCKKDFALAERQFRKTLEIDDNFGSAHWWLSRCLWQEEKREESIREIVRSLMLDQDEALARQLQEKAKIAKPADVISLLLSNWKMNPTKTNPHNLAYLSTYLDDREKALFWLEKSFEEHHPWTTWIKAAPEFEMLNNEPRFQALLKKMNLQ